MRQLSFFGDTLDDADADSAYFPEDGKNLEPSDTLPADGLERSCFFTGHRRLPNRFKPLLVQKLRLAVSYLYAQGVTDFYAGGAIGFDTLAATTVIDLRREHAGMRLFLELPFLNQADEWKEDERRFYDFVLSQADGIRYASEETVRTAARSRTLFLMRDRTMVDKCLHGIVYYAGIRGGTEYTVRYAEKMNRELVNLAELVKD